MFVGKVRLWPETWLPSAKRQNAVSQFHSLFWSLFALSQFFDGRMLLSSERLLHTYLPHPSIEIVLGRGKYANLQRCELHELTNRAKYRIDFANLSICKKSNSALFQSCQSHWERAESLFSQMCKNYNIYFVEVQNSSRVKGKLRSDRVNYY